MFKGGDVYAAKKVFVPGKDHMPYVKREIENLLYVVNSGAREQEKRKYKS